MLAMQIGEGCADLLPDHPDERLGHRLDDRHRGAVMTGSCGHLAADPAGPDDHDVSRPRPTVCVARVRRPTFGA